MSFGILMVNKIIHNHPLEDVIKDEHRMVATFVGAVGRRKD